jgi:rod shape-determining protein MreD
MIKKLLISIILFYFLALIQASFMPHFAIYGIVFNILLLVIIILNIFESSENYLGLYDAIIAGFFLDIFSNSFIGFNILILLTIAVLLKFFFRRYVRIPFTKEI